jgi:3-hydroxyisobutyrate dehydrogenase-like beta-hydroxyacid dehydrogenase
MHIGVVGLGAMGKAVAINLVGAGLRTTVWNRSPQHVGELVIRGAIGAREVGEVFHCDAVLSLLLDDAAVRAVFLESDILASAPAGTIHVCMQYADGHGLTDEDWSVALSKVARSRSLGS